MVCSASLAADSRAVARPGRIRPLPALATNSSGPVVESSYAVLCCFPCHNLVQPDTPGDGCSLSRLACARPFNFGYKLFHLGAFLLFFALAIVEVFLPIHPSYPLR